MARPLRVLPVKRISRDTEQSSALERQHAALSKAIFEGSHILVGWVEDSTVSGAVNLDERPSLGKWLKEPLVHEWEALMVTTQDRISRNDLHWWSFIDWCLKNKKTIIVLDDPSFDITTPNGRIMAGFKATQAANFRNDIKKKRLNQVSYYREEELWAGGPWPYGYRPKPVLHNGSKRFRLFKDPITAPLVREAWDRVVNKGHSLGEIADDWNDRKIPSATDHQKLINVEEGKELTASKLKGNGWSAKVLGRLLARPTIMGYAMHSGEIIRRNGRPVQWSEPIITRDEYDQMMNILGARQAKYATKTKTPTPLIGVLICKCGESMWSNTSTGKDGKLFYYVCRTKRRKVTRCQHAASWGMDLMHSILEEMFLQGIGDLEITTKTYVPGQNRTAEIAELKDSIENLAGSLSHLKPGSVAFNKVVKDLEEYEETLKELEAIPVVPSQWKEEGTGQTFGQWWANHLDWFERADFIKKAGIRMVVGGTPKSPDLHLFYPEELERRINDSISKVIEPGFPEMANEKVREAVMSLAS